MSKPTLPTINGVSASCVALPDGPWPTMLDYLAQRIPAVSREDWADRMGKGEVVDAHGHPISVDTPYRAHTKLYYWRSLPFEHRVPFDEEVVFQDDYLVVAYKPHFLPVTPKGRYLQETLLVRLKRKLGIDTLVPMHRIDRETAGLVAFTIQPHTRNAYQALFRDKVVNKTYEAIAPLSKAVALPMVYRSRLAESERFMAMHEVAGTPNAETRIELIESAGDWGRFKLQPVTGQKHQLRAHMSALGMPLLNDQIYPELLPALPPEVAPDFSRPLQLLAQSLSFMDPITAQQRDIHCGRSLDLTSALRQSDQSSPTDQPGEA
ncbi:MAG: pseudouridine synthase [Aquabacterium sp.]|uniref:pseudouridine synthase n=1 Tax=Aquabacterium sp. TaxID=1872578 RepID=UPI0025BAA39A|nr:pseudouridine synthase [Aquabacterium sp.]MBI5925776.1 pseudouridine synthase [Aquabacterium sp.]